MITLESTALATVTGGVTRGPSGSRKAQYREVCRAPDPATARAQYEWMRAHEIPDSSEAPGVKHRVVDAIGKLCGWDKKR